MKRRPSLASTLALAAVALAALGASAQQAVVAVSHKKRAFEPKEVEVGLGGNVVFVNDDGELLHHVYSKDARFAFDIGEQPAGTQVPVRFTSRGTFEIRCEIHPRMLLRVTVR
jgi:plastocyanin